MAYIENPKTKGSGIICAIPQTGECPVKCDDCFFQSGRSYLEPLADNLPNLPTLEESKGRVVRVNDGNDSNNQRDLVLGLTHQYEDKFYNTSMPIDLEGFKAPVVLTINPHKMTDVSFHKLKDIPKNLMFVRFRVNMWNLNLLEEAVSYYREHVPIVLTFMAYYTENIPEEYKDCYVWQKRILNSYNVLKPENASMVALHYRGLPVYTCGKGCKDCGHCLREYYNTKERLRG
jgi:hypothetical protein